MLTIKLTKSAVETEARDYENDMQYGTANIMPLVEAWFNKNRLACADSFFASVSNTLKLWDFGLRFTGVMRTATRVYLFLTYPVLRCREKENKTVSYPEVHLKNQA